MARNSRMSVYRNHQKEVSQYFLTKEDISSSNDIHNVKHALTYDHNQEEWRILIDSSKLSFKAVILRIQNT